MAIGWFLGGIALVALGTALICFRETVRSWRAAVERRTRKEEVDEDRRAYLMALGVVAPGVVAIIVGIAMLISSWP